jgi:hypothetical protein
MNSKENIIYTDDIYDNRNSKDVWNAIAKLELNMGIKIIETRILIKDK